MKAVYEAIRARIESECPDVAHVRVWNNQLALMEAREQLAFNFPADFIEFTENEYSQLGEGIQECNGLITLHICDNFYNGDDIEENLQIFDIKTDVFKALNDWKSTTARTSPFMRVNEAQDTEHSNVYHFIQTYAVRWQDASAQRPINGATVEDVELVLNKEVRITSQVIKTAGSF